MLNSGPRSIRTLIVLVIAALAMSAHPRANGDQQEAAAPPQIAPAALAQISALLQEKESRSPAEQKIDSQLIYEIKMRAGLPIAPGVDRLETDVPYAVDGHVIVDVMAQPSNNLAALFTSLGAEVLSTSDDGTSFRIHIAIDRITELAADPDVVFIQPRQMPKISRAIVPNTATGVTRRGAAVARMVSDAVQAPQNVITTTGAAGSRRSEGDIAHLAVVAREEFGATGKGVKIGVLSDGVANLAARQARGDLGPVTVLPGQEGSGEEGTAMLEIIHDIAPYAELYFASVAGKNVNIVSFAQNIRALQAAGCDIIVDDVLYAEESPFHDGQVTSQLNMGIVTQAVNDVTANGVLYFTSATNTGNVNDHTSGTWEGDYVDSGTRVANYKLHDFGPSANPRYENVLTVASQAPINLFWSDPLARASNDYDMFRLNAVGTVIASGTNAQSGKQDPYEQMPGNNAAPGQRILIAKKDPPVGTPVVPSFLHLDANGGRLAIATNGALRGHAIASGAFAIAATRVQPRFSKPFDKQNTVEPFSSDGPRRIFFDAANNPITPGNLLATGGLVRQKPDLTAADGVQVTANASVGSPMFGTSAAAPHAAAIAALAKSVVPALTPESLRAALASATIDIEGAGTDQDSGSGIIMADALLTALGATRKPVPVLELAGVDVAENPGNGNGVAEAGEGLKLSISVADYGGASARDVRMSLATSTPGITIESASLRTSDSIEPSKTWTPAGILVTVASNFPCPAAAAFTLTVEYTGGRRPSDVFSFEVPIGAASYTKSKKLDGNPFDPPDSRTATGLQRTQLSRNRVASTCGNPKPVPLLDPALVPPPATLNRQFDAYAFNTCQASAPSCVTVTLEGTNAISLFAAAYSSTFNPLSVQQNYKADAGTNSFFRTFSFDLPSGPQQFVIDVHDVAPGLPSNTEYSLTVTGACMGACDPPNQVPVAKAKNFEASANEVCKADATSNDIDDGSFDPDGGQPALTVAPAGPYSLGEDKPVVLTAMDSRGAFSQATAVVRVVDKTAPSLTCPAPKLVNNDPGVCGAAVSFKPTVSDACSVPVVVTSTRAPGSLFDVGTTTVSMTATDAAENESPACPFTVTVVDAEPPTINTLVLRPTRQSANRDFVDVTVDYGFDDNCRAATCVLSVAGGATRSTEASVIGSAVRGAVTNSDSGSGSDSDEVSFIIVDAHHVRLNADRSGKGNSRSYTITVTCTDAAGNKTVKSAPITVQRN